MGQSTLFLQIFAAKRHSDLADTLHNLWKRSQRHGKERFAHSLITDVTVLSNLTLLFINRNRWEEFTVNF